MKLTPPKVTTFLIALALVAVAVAGRFTPIRYVSDYSFWVLAAGFAVLALGVLFKGL